MRIGRTLPPAATPIGIKDIASGFRGILRGRKELDRFQFELKEYFGVRHCFLVSSGKAALTLILMALRELAPGRDEVLIPAFTCYSVPSSIVRANLKIRLCDMGPDDLDFDFGQLAAVLAGGTLPQAIMDGDGRAHAAPRDGMPGPTDGILAVVPTHLFGFPADVARLRQLLRNQGVTIVEDAAQAMGEMAGRGKLGTLGDVGFFSLARGKAFSVVEGGIILTDKDDLAEELNRRVAGLPSYGILGLLQVILKAVVLSIFTNPRVFWIPRSLPFLRLGETFFDPGFPILRMSAFQAGLARNWRVRMERFRESRKGGTDRWTAILREKAAFWTHVAKGRSAGLLRFPLRIPDERQRESLLRESDRRGMGIMPVYPSPINGIPQLAGRIEGGAFPVAERHARELVTLPTHEYVTELDARELGELVSRVMDLP